MQIGLVFLGALVIIALAGLAGIKIYELVASSNSTETKKEDQ